MTFQKALALHQAGKFASAQALYEEILKAHPGHFDALQCLGAIAIQTGKPQLAIELLDRAASINPVYAPLYYNRAIALGKLGKAYAALANYDQATRINAGYADAWFNRANLLKDLGQWEAALASYNQAVAANPKCAVAYSNRGNVLRELQDLEAAMASYDQALAIAPDYAEARFNRSITALLAGDFASGWRDYEWRWQNENCSASKERRNFAQSAWRGDETIAGKSILIFSEQGFGDTLQFCRYVKLVENLGAKVILEVQAPLSTLLSRLGGVSRLVTRGSELPAFDCHCPLLSLPLAFNTALDTVPSRAGYLSVDETRIAHWNSRLGPRTKPRIGLVWSGSVTHPNDLSRSIPLADLSSNLPNGFQYVSLQKDVRESDRRTLESNSQILRFDGDLVDFSDTAALCECLDLVISVDTSVAHLSGALGKRTWILLPSSPDWRWLLGRDDSPWYTSVRLYRQSNPGDWSGVLRRVASDLPALQND